MKKLHINGNVICAFCIFLLSIVYLIAANTLSLGIMKRPGVGFLPNVAGWLLAIFSFIELVMSFMKNNDVSKITIDWRKTGILLAGVVVYAISIKFSGFILTTFALIFFLTKLFGVKSWIKPLIFSALLAAGTYYLFAVVLMVELPEILFSL